MVCSGILPIDQMRDHVPPISLVCSRVPRPVLERLYGIRLPRPHEGEDPDRSPYAEELCGAYGCEFYIYFSSDEMPLQIVFPLVDALLVLPLKMILTLNVD